MLLNHKQIPFVFLMLLLTASIALLTACTADNLKDNRTDLSAKEHPITLTATVAGLTASRTTVEGTWQGGEVISGRVTDETLLNGGTVREFKGTVSIDGTIRLTDHNNEPLYWQSTGDKYAISLNYPADFVSVKANQSTLAAHLASDQMTFVGDVSFSNPSLSFVHQTARVTVDLIPGEGISSVEGAAVAFISQMSVENNAGTVIPYANATALLTPQQMMGKPFISVTLNDILYTYIPSTATEAHLKPGYSYLYKVTVNKSKLTVEVSSGPTWTGGTTEDVISKTIAPGFASADLKIGDYYYSDGTWSDGGYRKYSDGTTDQFPIGLVAGKTCIGIVFETNPDRMSSSDRNKGWTHGYVFALTNAPNAQWGENKDEQSTNVGMINTDTVFDKNVNNLGKLYRDLEGFRANRFVIDNYGSGDGEKLKNTKYEAFYNASQYGKTYDTQPFAAPTASSGWFLPSGGQWWSVLENLGKLDMSSAVNSTNFFVDFSPAGIATLNNMNAWTAEIPGSIPFYLGEYWTTSVFRDHLVFQVAFYGEPLRLATAQKTNDYYGIRCILAF